MGWTLEPKGSWGVLTWSGTTYNPATDAGEVTRVLSLPGSWPGPGMYQQGADYHALAGVDYSDVLTGPAGGGATVAIFGPQAAAASGVTFGGKPATGFQIINGRIVCVTPPHKPGTVDVVVATAAGDVKISAYIYS